MPKYKAILQNKNLLQKDFAAKIGISAEEASRIARGKILPTVKKLEIICALLEVKPLDLYEKKEIDLLSVLKGEREPLEPDTYRFSARLPREWCGVLMDKEKLRKCGYYSKTHWLKVCLGRLTKQYEAIEKWEANSAKLPKTPLPREVASIPHAAKGQRR
jgi:transcriptional regulator with XRE-family HTH domain